MNITYTFCHICGALADDSCSVHPDGGVVVEIHHPDDYATARQAHAYANVLGNSVGFHVLLNALTLARKEHGKVFEATPEGLRCITKN